LPLVTGGEGATPLIQIPSQTQATPVQGSATAGNSTQATQ
jgi:hypothetical protein